MNPPLSDVERGMYHEIFSELRHVRDAVTKVHESLDQHVRDEDTQYSELRREMSDLRADVASLKTRWGILASFAAIVGAAVMAAVNKAIGFF